MSVRFGTPRGSAWPGGRGDRTPLGSSPPRPVGIRAERPETSGCLTIRATPPGPGIALRPAAGSTSGDVRMAHHPSHPARPRGRPPTGGWQYIRRRPDASPCEPLSPTHLAGQPYGWFPVRSAASGRRRAAWWRTLWTIRTSPPHRRPGPADPGPPRDPSGRLPRRHPADAARLTGPVELDARYRPWSSRHAPRAGAPTLRPARWRRRAPPCGRDARRRRRWR